MQNKTIQEPKTLPLFIRLLTGKITVWNFKMLVNKKPCYVLCEDTLWFFNGADQHIRIEIRSKIHELYQLFPENTDQPTATSIQDLQQLNDLINHKPLKKYIDRYYKNSFNAFCSIYNQEKNQLPNVLIDHIGSFFIPAQKIRSQCISLSRQRKESLKLQQVFINFQNNKNLDLFTLCKHHLLNDAQFIGPRHKNVKFCIDNIGKCFPNEATWPDSVQALIYLQVFIQQQEQAQEQEQSCLLSISIAKSIKNQCLNIEDDTVYIIDDQPFLGKIHLLCQQSGLIQPIIDDEEEQDNNHQCTIQ